MVIVLTKCKVYTRYLQVHCKMTAKMRVVFVHIVQVMFRVVSARIGWVGLGWVRLD